MAAAGSTRSKTPAPRRSPAREPEAPGGGDLVLAGDIGGSHTRLALFDRHRVAVQARTYSSREHAGIEAIVRDFLGREGRRFVRACLGVAGPVREGRSRVTNLPWIIDARGLEKALGMGPVLLINDLEATAHGIAALRPEDLAVLSEGAAAAGGNGALIAAGTGLGEAGLYWDGATHRPFACEGGHASFAPRTELEVHLLAHLRSRFGHVSWERVVSGPGLVSLYGFLRGRVGGGEPAWLEEEMRRGDPAEAISRAALEGRCEVCVRALDLFVELYGAEAGNLALKMMATGGVTIGGGIAPRILEKMRGAAFLEAFWSKGRMRPLLESMPVRVILNDGTALLGAARRAALAG